MDKTLPFEELLMYGEGMRCEYFGICGGCSLQDRDMSSQLEIKQRDMLAMFREHGGIEPCTVLPPIEGPSWGYRHRARLAVKRVSSGDKVLVGFREKDSRFVTDMKRCPILSEPISLLISPLRHLIGELSIPQRIPQVEVSVGENSISLILRHLDPLSAQDLIKLEKFEMEHNVAFFLQPGGMDSTVPLNMGNPPTLSYSLPPWDLVFEFGPTDFIQINPAVNVQLVEMVVKLLQPEEGDCIADLFCGLGNFSLPLARYGVEVRGYELAGLQVLHARRNAEINGLADMVSFHECNLYEAGDFSFLCGYNKIILDPPRLGADGIVESMHSMSARRIVYVSCNPKTLAHDAKVLAKYFGFNLIACGVVNMFPHTLHSEAIAMLER